MASGPSPRHLLTVTVACVLLTAGAVGLAACGDDEGAATPTTQLTLPGGSGPDSTTTTTSGGTTGGSGGTAVNPLLAPSPPAPVSLPPVAPGLAPVVSRVPTTEKVIFMTIDDGMFRDPAVIQKFRELGIPFTMFLNTGYAEEDPAFFRGLQQAGGNVQGHTINHPNLATLGAPAVRAQVCGTNDTFTRLFGTPQTLFRPPYGNTNATVQQAAASCGYRAVVLWKGSTNGGKLTMQDGPLKPGDIILMHFRDTLGADIDDVTRRAREEGFRFGRLEDWLVGPSPLPPPPAPVTTAAR
ncbi:MAG: polysaccharide deacetylase family protein [Microthrixaceae bacterium]